MPTDINKLLDVSHHVSQHGTQAKLIIAWTHTSEFLSATITRNGLDDIIVWDDHTMRS